MKIATLPEKSHSPLSHQPLSKSWCPVKPPPFWKFGWRLNPAPPPERGGGANYVKHGLNSVSKLGKLSYFLSKLCIFGMDISKNKANITAQDYDWSFSH